MTPLIGIILIAGAAGVFFLLRRTMQTATPAPTTPTGFHDSVPISPTTNVVGKVSLEVAVLRLSTSIARFETGFHKRNPLPGTWRLNPNEWEGAAVRNLNPGNLRFGFQKGAVGTDARQYTIFKNVSVGWAALLADVRAKITGRTRTNLGPWSSIGEFISVYAPVSDSNPTAAYISFVSKELDIPADKPFNQWVEVN